jgi:hypothetical protein
MHEKIHAEDCLDCKTKEGIIERTEAEILLSGNLTDEQHQRLLQIANKCPVHRTLISEIRIETRLLDGLLPIPRYAYVQPAESNRPRNAEAPPFASFRS